MNKYLNAVLTPLKSITFWLAWLFLVDVNLVYDYLNHPAWMTFCGYLLYCVGAWTIIFAVERYFKTRADLKKLLKKNDDDSRAFWLRRLEHIKQGAALCDSSQNNNSQSLS